MSNDSKEAIELTTQPVKNNLIMVLDVLKNHSDVNHRLSQKEITHYLSTDYGLKCDRKTVKRNLMNLVEYGFDIEYDTISRGDGEGGNTVCTNWYYNHAFEDSEVKLISDGLLFSKYISANKTKALIEKAESQSSPFSVNMLKNAVNYETLGHTENQQIFYTVEMLNIAIKEKNQVEFSYCEYGTDKKLHPKHDFKQIINPYYTVTANGRYYLIGNVDKFANIAHFRVDKIKDIEILEATQKPVKQLDNYHNGFNLSEYMQDHIYMFSGEICHARLEIDSFLLGQIIDWFGKDFSVISQTESKCEISLKANENALFYWAMQYGQFVKVLSPKSVRDRVYITVKKMVERYEEEE